MSTMAADAAANERDVIVLPLRRIHAVHHSGLAASGAQSFSQSFSHAQPQVHAQSQAQSGAQSDVQVPSEMQTHSQSHGRVLHGSGADADSHAASHTPVPASASNSAAAAAGYASASASASAASSGAGSSQSLGLQLAISPALVELIRASDRARGARSQHACGELQANEPPQTQPQPQPQRRHQEFDAMADEQSVAAAADSVIPGINESATLQPLQGIEADFFEEPGSPLRQAASPLPQLGGQEHPGHETLAPIVTATAHVPASWDDEGAYDDLPHAAAPVPARSDSTTHARETLDQPEPVLPQANDDVAAAPLARAPRSTHEGIDIEDAFSNAGDEAPRQGRGCDEHQDEDSHDSGDERLADDALAAQSRLREGQSLMTEAESLIGLWENALGLTTASAGAAAAAVAATEATRQAGVGSNRGPPAAQADDSVSEPQPLLLLNINRLAAEVFADALPDGEASGGLSEAAAARVLRQTYCVLTGRDPAEADEGHGTAQPRADSIAGASAAAAANSKGAGAGAAAAHGGAVQPRLKVGGDRDSDWAPFAPSGGGGGWGPRDAVGGAAASDVAWAAPYAVMHTFARVPSQRDSKVRDRGILLPGLMHLNAVRVALPATQAFDATGASLRVQAAGASAAGAWVRGCELLMSNGVAIHTRTDAARADVTAAAASLAPELRPDASREGHPAADTLVLACVAYPPELQFHPGSNGTPFALWRHLVSESHAWNNRNRDWQAVVAAMRGLIEACHRSLPWKSAAWAEVKRLADEAAGGAVAPPPEPWWALPTDMLRGSALVRFLPPLLDRGIDLGGGEHSTRSSSGQHAAALVEMADAVGADLRLAAAAHALNAAEISTETAAAAQREGAGQDRVPEGPYVEGDIHGLPTWCVLGADAAADILDAWEAAFGRLPGVRAINEHATADARHSLTAAPSQQAEARSFDVDATEDEAPVRATAAPPARDVRPDVTDPATLLLVGAMQASGVPWAPAATTAFASGGSAAASTSSSGIESVRNGGGGASEPGPTDADIRAGRLAVGLPKFLRRE